MNTRDKTAKVVAIFVFIIAAISLLDLTTSASHVFAQGRKGGGGPAASPEDDMKKKKRAEEERAAKAAMDKIPDSKVKYDPWKIER